MLIARVTTVFVVGLLWAQGGLACEDPGKTHRLKFQVKGDECVEKVKKEDDDADAETIRVCVTDTDRPSRSSSMKTRLSTGRSRASSATGSSGS